MKRLADDAAARPDRNWPARIDPGLRRLREATVIMAAALPSSATAPGTGHTARRTTSVVILALALALALSPGRQGQRPATQLVLLTATQRQLRGTASQCSPSPFLASVDPALVERRGGEAAGWGGRRDKGEQLRLL